MSARRRRVGAEPDNNHQTSSYYQNGAVQLYDNEDNSLLGTQQQEQLIAPTMTSRDRTQEFGNAIQMLQSKNISRAAVLRSPRQARHLQSYSNFMLISQNIGKNIASTYAKLEKLALRKDRQSSLTLFLRVPLVPCLPRKASSSSFSFSRQEEVHLRRQTVGDRGAHIYHWRRSG